MPGARPQCAAQRPGTHAGRSIPLNATYTYETFDERLDQSLAALIDDIEAAALPRCDDDPSLYGMIRYHLGQVDEHFQPARFDAGKRIRSRLCVMTCEALGGDPDDALPVAAAIEMIHNFTLIHDDIQDRSELRRHRTTVWTLWGEAQAINAGDALFVLAHLMLNSTRASGLDPATVLDLSNELHMTTLRIVEGQVLDLGFEDRPDVGPDEYLRMIGGKTAAIIRFACLAGARVAAAGDETTGHLAAFGQSLGMGFQIRDDLLGVWGKPEQTGKPEADDIRRRKKSLPILLLRERVSDPDWERLTGYYRQPEITDAQIDEILTLLDHYRIAPFVQAEVERWHADAVTHLTAAIPDHTARAPLEALTDALVERRA